MSITATMVKELREVSGAGMMDAKKALTETNGDMEAAIDWLRTKGLAKAAKKSGRTAAEGLVGVAVKGGVDYRPPTPTSTAKLRLAVVVISSKLPSCRRGAPGTLTVTTAPQVRLTVCGRSFLQGKATASILQL